MKAIEQHEKKQDVDEYFIMSLSQKVAIGKPGKASASVGAAVVSPAIPTFFPAVSRASSLAFKQPKLGPEAPQRCKSPQSNMRRGGRMAIMQCSQINR